MATTLAGLVWPEPVVLPWGSSIAWPGPGGVAIVGVRRHAREDADVALEALRSSTPTIILGMPSAHAGDILRAGATQVLPRDCTPTDLVYAVESLRRTRPSRTHGRSAGPLDPTPRELEVTTLLAQGLSNREIASALYISEHTVRNHLGHVFAKLGVSSRTQAVVRAGQLGWLRLPG